MSSCRGLFLVALVARFKNSKGLHLLYDIFHTSPTSESCSQNCYHNNDEEIECHHAPPSYDAPYFAWLLSLVLHTPESINQSYAQLVDHLAPDRPCLSLEKVGCSISFGDIRLSILLGHAHLYLVISHALK